MWNLKSHLKYFINCIYAHASVLWCYCMFWPFLLITWECFGLPFIKRSALTFIHSFIVWTFKIKVNITTSLWCNKQCAWIQTSWLFLFCYEQFQSADRLLWRKRTGTMSTLLNDNYTCRSKCRASNFRFKSFWCNANISG